MVALVGVATEEVMVATGAKPAGLEPLLGAAAACLLERGWLSRP
jgi:hypothetical protein